MNAFALQIINSVLSTSKTLQHSVIIDLEKLKEHEEINPGHMGELKYRIQKDGKLKSPIIVDKNTKIILDGHHRFNSLKKLGYKKIPVYFIDYNSPDIVVRSWREKDNITKEVVIKAGLSGIKLPPKTSKHMIKISDKLIRIAKLVGKVNVPLEKLGKVENNGNSK